MMKNRMLSGIMMALLMVFAVACGSSTKDASASSEPRDPTAPYKNYNNLADVLRTQRGLIVTGSGRNVNIQLRGSNSIVLDTRPLFEVNGVVMGRDYNAVNGAINPKEIKRLRVLSSLTQTNRYGEMGRNGVIQIWTNTFADTGKTERNRDREGSDN